MEWTTWPSRRIRLAHRKSGPRRKLSSKLLKAVTRSTGTNCGDPSVPVSKWVRVAGNTISMPRGDRTLGHKLQVHHLCSGSHGLAEVTHHCGEARSTEKMLIVPLNGGCLSLPRHFSVMRCGNLQWANEWCLGVTPYLRPWELVSLPTNEWWYGPMEYKWKWPPLLQDFTDNIQALRQACGEAMSWFLKRIKEWMMLWWRHCKLRILNHTVNCNECYICLLKAYETKAPWIEVWGSHFCRLTCNTAKQPLTMSGD
jgi:hypothetical protein